MSTAADGHRPTSRLAYITLLALGIVFTVLGVVGYITQSPAQGQSLQEARNPKSAQVDEENGTVAPEADAPASDTLEDARNQWYAEAYFPSKVNDHFEAADALAIIRLTIGSKVNIREEADLETEELHHYRFSQTYEGLDVHARGVTLTVAKDGTVIGASSNLVDVQDVPTKEKVERPAAEKTALEHVAQLSGQPKEDLRASGSKLLVYSIETEPTLSWRFMVETPSGDFETFVDAQSGTVIASLGTKTNAQSEPVNATGQRGTTYTLDITDNKEASNLDDSERRISVYTLGWKPDIDSERSKSKIATTSCMSGVDALGNLAATYDFYMNYLGWKGYDGRNSQLKAYVEATDTEMGDNAYWDREKNIIVFTSREDQAPQHSSGLDIVAHEYTHAVTQYTCKLTGGKTSASAAVDEALSDILGEATEKAVTGTCDWMIAAGSQVSGGTIRHFDNDQHYTKGAECHTNALVIDRIAYHIGNGQDNVRGQTKEQTRLFDASDPHDKRGLKTYARLWHNVQCMLTPTSTLRHLSSVTCEMARHMRDAGELSEAQYDGVVAAFTQEGLAPLIKRPRSAAEGETGSATALVFDVSGSMSGQAEQANQNKEADQSTGRATKLDVAKQAGNELVSRVEKMDGRYQKQFLLGIASFAQKAKNLALPTSDLRIIRSAIERLEAGGGTNIKDGIEKGIDQVKSYDGHRAILLLSDGEDTAGNSDSEILATAAEAKQNEIVIYTIGLGADDSDLDGELLQDIAEETGGTYLRADPNDVISLIAGFLHAQADTTGDILSEQKGTLSKGQTSDAEHFEITDKAGDLDALLYWPGSQMQTILVDPTGRTVTEGYHGAELDTQTIPSEITIKDPLPGIWSVQVHAEETSQDNEPYYSLVSFQEVDGPTTRPLSAIARASAIVLPIGCILVVVSLTLLVTGSGRRQTSGAAVT